MRISSIGLLFLVLTNVIAQETDYENIFGTRVSINIPDGFENINGFKTGFKKGFEAHFFIKESTKENYYTNTVNFTRDFFLQKKEHILSFEKVKIDGYYGKLVEVNKGNHNFIQIVFGDATFQVSMYAFFLNKDTDLRNVIRNTLINVIYDKSKMLDIYEKTFFSFDDRQTDSKHVGTTGNIYKYSIIKENVEEQPVIYVFPGLSDVKIPVQKAAIKVLNGLKRKGLREVVVITQSPNTVNGYEGYEIIAKGKSISGNITHVLIQILIHKEHQLIIQGIETNDQFEEAISFRELIQTVHFK